jgi:hypothetical protein
MSRAGATVFVAVSRAMEPGKVAAVADVPLILASTSPSRIIDDGLQAGPRWASESLRFGGGISRRPGSHATRSWHLRTGIRRLAAVIVLLGSAISSFLAAKNRGKLRGAMPMGIVEVLDGMVRA